MSRTPFWQPGDSWQPPIVRINGVDEKSEAGQSLLQAYAGPARQFYFAAARAYALGTVDISRLKKQFPDVTMQYTNLQGQEIIDLEFRPEVVERAKYPQEKVDHGRAALLEMYIPAGYLGAGTFMIRRLRGGETVLNLATPYEVPRKDVALSDNGTSWDMGSGTIAAGATTSTTSAITNGPVRVSFAVDLGDEHAERIIRVEVYGKVRAAELKTESFLGSDILYDQVPTYYSTGPATPTIKVIRVGGGGPGVIGFTNPSLRNLDNEFIYHNPWLDGQLIAEADFGGGGFANMSVVKGDLANNRLLSQGYSVWADTANPYWSSPITLTTSFWQGSQTVPLAMTSAIPVQARGKVVDGMPGATYTWKLSAATLNAPAHMLGTNNPNIYSVAWQNPHTGGPVDTPQVGTASMLPTSIFSDPGLVYSGGVWHAPVDLDYVGRFEINLWKRSVAFRAA